MEHGYDFGIYPDASDAPLSHPINHFQIFLCGDIWNLHWGKGDERGIYIIRGHWMRFKFAIIRNAGQQNYFQLGFPVFCFKWNFCWVGMIKHNMSIQDTFIDKLQQFGHAHCYLVGGFNPIWKILVKLEIFPKFRGENKQYLKPPPSYSLSKNIIKTNSSYWKTLVVIYFRFEKLEFSSWKTHKSFWQKKTIC